MYSLLLELKSINLKNSRDPKTSEQDETALGNAVVNSPVLSLTTQTGLGVLVPPLNLMFRHAKNVRIKNKCTCIYFIITKTYT